ncbi:MAG: LysM peptidoglycan-binding domain-containing protein [Acidimicrobiia bacterium]|nr:LysM peptidoglycan-binding domain-containing protein [Acidimicrobiia bacterium]
MPTTVSHRMRGIALLLAVGVAFALLLVTATGATATGDPIEAPAVATVEYEVEAGDTLWAIAETITAPGDDIRRVVFDIQQANDLPDSVILPGQVLILPTG